MRLTRRQSLIAWLTFLLLLTVVSPAGASLQTGTAAAVTTPSAVERELLILINRERSRAGLRSVALDAQVARAARAKATEMAKRNYFSHTSPTYGSVSSLLRRWGIRYSVYAETLGRGRSAAHIHGMMMASPSHKALILGRHFTHVGLGAARTSTGYAVSELFIGR
jgi:uncharacterized protein YkwD